MEKLNRAVLVETFAEGEEVQTRVIAVTTNSIPEIIGGENRVADAFVLTTALGALIREVEEKGLMTPGACMEMVIKTLNNIYVTNDIAFSDGDEQRREKDNSNA